MIVQIALLSQVLNVEQVMTTGGGWQDQVGAVYGGVKRGRSGATLPLRVYIDYVGQASASASASQCAGDADADASRTPTTTNEIRLSKAQLSPAQAASLADFDERLVLIYTGKTRLARNLLQVLRPSSRLLVIERTFYVFAFYDPLCAVMYCSRVGCDPQLVRARRDSSRDGRPARGGRQRVLLRVPRRRRRGGRALCGRVLAAEAAHGARL